MKKILIIPIILILFLSFAAVSASDSNDTKTFEDVQNAVEAGDVIELEGLYSGSGDAIVISRPVTVRGSDARLDAGGNSQILNIQSDNVTIENISFANGNPKRLDSRNYGGAIYVDADNVKIINCIFTSNSAEYGGAIAAFGENISIINCRFVSNYATYSGGAFEIDGGNCHVNGCEFTDNTAGHVGGAVSWVGANGVLLNSSFETEMVAGTKSPQYGGAVCWMGANGLMADSSVSFAKAKKSGAAIYWKGADGCVTHCEFRNNTSPMDLAYFGNPGFANHNYWGADIFSASDFIAQKLIYFEDGFRAPESWINTLTISCSNLETFNVVNAKNGKYFRATLKDSNGNPLGSKAVLIYFNGNVYERTSDKSGEVSLQINVKNPGKYNVDVVFKGDDFHKSAFKTVKVTVKKQKPALTVATKTLKLKAKKKIVKVYLKDQFKKAISKRTVKITINKKTYSAKTNSKGLASLKVTLKAKKNYSATVKFAGDKYYSSAKKSAKIRVK